MGVPSFLLRKLYKRGSLRATGDDRFAFEMHNPIAAVHLIGAPHLVVNGIEHAVERVEVTDLREGARLDLTSASAETPVLFARGAHWGLRLRGRLLLGGNRIHVAVETKEFGDVEFLVEVRQAAGDDRGMPE